MKLISDTPTELDGREGELWVQGRLGGGGEMERKKKQRLLRGRWVNASGNPSNTTTRTAGP